MTTKHARLGASGSSIWLNCTKSGQLSRTDVYVPKKDTVYTLEGSAAHELAEKCLTDGQDADFYRDLEFGDHFIADREMCENVQVFLDACRAVWGKHGGWRGIEITVSLDDLWKNGAPEPLFGTADFVSINGDAIYVVDLKYGKGVPVDVVGNPQLLYYALGAYFYARSRARVAHIKRVVMTIVQPRADHPDGPVRSWEIPLLDLLMWGDDVVKRTVDAIVSGNVIYKSGQHCRWCPVAGRCPELRRKALEAARTQFDDVDFSHTPPAPDAIPLEDLGKALDQAELVYAWLSSARAAVSHAIETGKQIPGWKLVDKRASRKWAVPESDVFKRLADEGFDLDDFMTPRKALSPPQVETVLKRQHRISLEDANLEDLITKESSGTTLVRDKDDRPAAPTGPRAVFDDVSL